MLQIRNDNELQRTRGFFCAIALDQLTDSEESCFLGGLRQSSIETDERATARLLLAPDQSGSKWKRIEGAKSILVSR